MSSSERRELQIESLERLSESDLPKAIMGLNDEQFFALNQLVEDVLARERKGFDRFFESMSQTLKYIPNFLVLAITNKYIDPPIAARITSKLPIKNAVHIAKGLSVDYICETAIYMEEAYAAELLGKVPKKLTESVITKLMAEHPLRVLDIFEFADTRLCKLASASGSDYSEIEIDLNEVRKKTLQKLRY